MLALAAKSNGNPAIGLIIVGAIAAIVWIVSRIAGNRRRDALAKFAAENDLFFAPDADGNHMKYESFAPFGSGHARRSSNLIHGRRGDIEWEAFDYKYTTGSGKNQSTHRRGIVVGIVPLYFRKLTMRPEGFFDKVTQMVTGSSDINFESEEFSRRYHVSCDVRKFAYDLLDPRMIEFLLTCPLRYWQFAGDIILIHKDGEFSTGEIADSIRAIEGFVQRIPDFVRQDMSLHAPTPRA